MFMTLTARVRLSFQILTCRASAAPSNMCAADLQVGASARCSIAEEGGGTKGQFQSKCANV